MNKDYFLDNISDETLAELIDETIRLEKNKITHGHDIKFNLLKIIPAAACVLFIIGLINILPIFMGGVNSDVGSQGVGQPDVTINLPSAENNNLLTIDDNALVSVGNSTDTENNRNENENDDDTIKLFVPPIVEKNFFEEQVLANITNQREYEKMLAYYILIDLSDPNWDAQPEVPPTDGYDLLPTLSKEEIIAMYPICETVAVYILDSQASDRELSQLLGFFQTYTYLTGDDLIQMYKDFDIPYEDYDFFTGEITDETSEISEISEISETGEETANGEILTPNYGINVNDDGTPYLEFKNKSLYAALLEYFGLDRWFDGHITPEMLKACLKTSP